MSAAVRIDLVLVVTTVRNDGVWTPAPGVLTPDLAGAGESARVLRLR